MKIKLSCLSVELTRRCNYKCAHCFKGEEQPIDLKNEHIKKIFGMIEEIYTLHISGETITQINTWQGGLYL